MSHVLIVDDEESICWGLKRLVGSLGCTTSIAATGEQACETAAREDIDLAIVDVRLPGMDGLSLMRRLQADGNNFPFIVITAYGDLRTAVDALQSGAFDYIPKPFDIAVVERAVTSALASQAHRPTNIESEQTETRQRIVGTSPAMQEVFRQVAMVASTDASVHLHGESGTGKEMIARAIHQYSGRRSGPFVVVHAAAINMALAESELFGHVRGSFTGAEETRRGLLEQAHGGTLFFDEVGDIPIELQTKLLRAIEYGEIVPVGGQRPIQCDFRMISATHRDLRQCTAEGTFREDLYFRLVSYTISLPPLRKRREDIRELAKHFLATLSSKSENSPPILDEDALALLEARPWLGNVRELRNAMEHALIASRGGIIRSEHLPSTSAIRPSDRSEIQEAVARWLQKRIADNSQAGDVYREFLELVERPLFLEMLERHHGNVASAARQLGIHRVTLKRKLDEYEGR